MATREGREEVFTKRVDRGLSQCIPALCKLSGYIDLSAFALVNEQGQFEAEPSCRPVLHRIGRALFQCASCHSLLPSFFPVDVFNRCSCRCFQSLFLSLFPIVVSVVLPVVFYYVLSLFLSLLMLPLVVVLIAWLCCSPIHATVCCITRNTKK
ncbi:MAG: hypothetical protein J3R72DRAFT_457015 [Linnemannia gamsii]|nr:MAG: hypothetical protein J3R72DRAFT_457015 [Linnemannia gamsii]